MTTASAGKRFGKHVRSLRRTRGLTQEALAERSGLSPDTIRRLEHGSFSPSLDTLMKLVRGLDLQLSTLFRGHELREPDKRQELVDLLERQAPRALRIGARVLRSLLAQLDVLAKSHDEGGEGW